MYFLKTRLFVLIIGILVVFVPKTYSKKYEGEDYNYDGKSYGKDYLILPNPHTTYYPADANLNNLYNHGFDGTYLSRKNFVDEESDNVVTNCITGGYHISQNPFSFSIPAVLLGFPYVSQELDGFTRPLSGPYGFGVVAYPEYGESYSEAVKTVVRKATIYAINRSLQAGTQKAMEIADQLAEEAGSQAASLTGNLPPSEAASEASSQAIVTATKIIIIEIKRVANYFAGQAQSKLISKAIYKFNQIAIQAGKEVARKAINQAKRQAASKAASLAGSLPAEDVAYEVAKQVTKRIIIQATEKANDISMKEAKNALEKQLENQSVKQAVTIQ